MSSAGMPLAGAITTQGRGFEMIVLTPAALIDPSLAIAASRAGETGVLDLEYAQDDQAAREAIARLARYARGRFGLKLSGRNPDFFAKIAPVLPASLNLVILTQGTQAQLRRLVRTLHRRGITVLLECTSLEEARCGEQLGVDGVIAKGHEASGSVGEETAFVLLQRFLAQLSLPTWVQGGIGLHTASACHAAGAVGVVLDSQLYLALESGLPEAVRSKIVSMEGSETVCLGQVVGECYRVYSRPGSTAVAELQEEEKRLAESGRPRAEVLAEWRQAVSQRIGWDEPEKELWLLGQDVAFAASLVKRFGNVAGILQGLRRAISSHQQAACVLRPLDEGAPLAAAHGTRYPIVQGPMTRVSDIPTFAAAVAEGGALPFLALALMDGPEVRALLEETQSLLKGRPWGVGILGFVPREVREKQLEAMRACRPPFALIAGGRPDQARMLEQEGIPTYLHVPSPGLLELFLAEGARRFVFEGRECGGHVGPRSSFVLWESMIEVLLQRLPPDRERAQQYHVLFAGGIHDSLSASMVAVMAAPLAERGVRIGVLLGTAYIFTEEAVATGAITRGFQEEALCCDGTALLETGPGHAVRCVNTPYVQTFRDEKRRLAREGRSPQEIRLALEALNLGRLRIASKGIARNNGEEQASSARFRKLSEEEQRAQGMYMIGQVAALRSATATIEALHYDVAVRGSQRLGALSTEGEAAPEEQPSQPSDIAIIGMSCILPKAPSLETYWQHILNKVYAITEVPAERWDWRLYYDPDPRAKDKVYSKWGGFLDDIPFDPMSYGMPPTSLSSIEPLHLLTLEAVRAALKDAGYLQRPFDRERVSVILGAGGAGDLGQMYGFRSFLPQMMGDAASGLLSRLDGILPEWTEDSFPGILTNVAAGRVANRFDFGGVNYTVDAACASSLAALQLAVKELEMGTSDMVIVGGADTIQSPFAFLCFSKTYALSPSGECRPFDEKADGIAISEGVGMLVLKRLSDAERDGDRIYAVIKGVGGSSDGRDKGLTAPRPEGQMLALRRAYAKANVSPATVSLVEAHGTGTVVGDRAELESLARVFKEAEAPAQSCAIGSVKSMIGHTKNAAGVASVIKTALALHHRILPPTLGVEKPTPEVDLSAGPLYINTEPRPWLQRQGVPRRAGVSAFGFGGTNFHAVLEEYTGDYLRQPAKVPLRRQPAELFLWRKDSRQQLAEAIDLLREALSKGARPPLPDLAFMLYADFQAAQASGQPKATLAVVATSLDDLQSKLLAAREYLTASLDVRVTDPRGIYFSQAPLAPEGKVAFLFPGQGSQYINMLRELAVDFPEVQEQFERADQALSDILPAPLSACIFPPPTFSQEEEKAQQEVLTQTNVAQPAMAVADLALFHLLERLGIRPHFVAGHSFGEYVALCAAGVLGEEDLLALAEARGRFIVEAAGQEPGAMAAVEADPEEVRRALAGLEGLVLANHNAPKQTVIAGARPAVQRALQRFESLGLRARTIPVACAFHSPIVAPAQERLAEFLSSLELREPQTEVFSNTTATAYPRKPKAIASQLVEHLIRPVRFVEEIEAMYAAGGRIFIEVGPRNVLSALVDQILNERAHLTVATDQPGRSATVQLLHVLGRLATEGVQLKLDRLFAGISVGHPDLNSLLEETARHALGPGVWLVNGGRARPSVDGPRPAPAGGQEPLAGAAGDRRGADVASEPARAVARGPETEAPPASGKAPPLEPAGPGTPAAGTPKAGAAKADEVTQVMSQFQQLMQRFLETQQSVMLAYLRSRQRGCLGAGIEAAEHRAPTPYSSPPELVERAQAAASPQAIPATSPVATEGTIDSMGEKSSETGAGVLAETRPPPSEADLTDRLLQLVSERTGYPPEMLDLDLDLEADLGIDSIKRVEILGNYLRSYAQTDYPVSEAEMEKLTSIRTLRGIIEWITAHMRSIGVGAAVQNVPQASADDSDQQAGAGRGKDEGSIEEGVLQRYTLIPVEVPPINSRIEPPNLAGLVLVTDDENGLAQFLAEQLSERGQPVALLRMGSEMTEVAPGRYVADLTSPEAIAEVVSLIRRQQGAIAGLIHLLALKARESHSELDFTAWRQRLRLEVESLFYLARELRQDLEQAARQGGACLMAATAMGGAFASGRPSTEITPSHGGIVGLVKSLAQEWPSVRVKVVDLDSRDSAAILAGRLAQELTADDGHVEVGYAGGRRLALRPQPAPLEPREQLSPAIDSSILLIAGGARGITAQVALHLAERYRPTLLLIGRSPMPEAEEAPDTAGLETPQQLKAALIERMRRQGQQPVVAQIEEEFAKLQREREIRSSLAAMRRAGANVHYFSVDVRDEASFGSLIDGIYDSFGRIDGVIYGAGIIEDKLVHDKTPESFHRVLDTKVDGAFTLSRKLRPESLRFLTFFSSTAARFGNRGQADYAAANEVLNKLALHLDSRWPGRVVSINWGPWLKQGMVSAELEKEFARRGIGLISPPAGCHSLDQELNYGRKGEVEVLLTAGGQVIPSEALPAWRERPLPMLDGLAPLGGENGSIEMALTLDPPRYPYLRDHQLAGKPVLPLAVAAELMAEVASVACPEMELTALRDLQVLRGIVLDSGPRAIRVRARPGAARCGEAMQVEVSITGQADPQPVHYRAIAELAPCLLHPAPSDIPSFGVMDEFPLSIDEAYRQWLFQGPAFRGVEIIHGVAGQGIVGSLIPSSPHQLLADEATGGWLIDPVVIDSGLQLVILWSHLYRDRTPLPSRFRIYRRYAPLAGERIHCQVRIRDAPEGHVFHCDLFFLSSDGQVLGVLEDLEVACGISSDAMTEGPGR